MSLDDFERCTPLEFYEAWRQWAERRRDMERGEWERMRMLAVFFIQPYSKKSLSPHDLLPLPWDEKPRDKVQEQVGKDEFARRYAEAKKRNGLK